MDAQNLEGKTNLKRKLKSKLVIYRKVLVKFDCFDAYSITLFFLILRSADPPNLLEGLGPMAPNIHSQS